VKYAVKERFRRPSQALHLSEFARAWLDWGSLQLAEPWFSALPGGDGQPVLVIPGFTAGDRSTSILRRFLARLGYLPTGWNQGVNFGVRHEAFEGVARLLDQLQREYGCGVSLVGQSLGGIYARELAKRNPERVRQVITLGSPFNDPGGHASNVTELYRLFNPGHASKAEQIRREHWEIPAPPPVPTTAIFSRWDGVCHWRACIQHGGHEQVENIEVMASHTGMAVNPQTLLIIADRLAQRHGGWKPFQRGGGTPRPG
jgi:pimeloyl-ACP methyl ester carboxylesterase